MIILKQNNKTKKNKNKNQILEYDKKSDQILLQIEISK